MVIAIKVTSTAPPSNAYLSTPLHMGLAQNMKCLIHQKVGGWLLEVYFVGAHTCSKKIEKHINIKLGSQNNASYFSIFFGTPCRYIHSVYVNSVVITQKWYGMLHAC